MINPSERWCFGVCSSCYRCENKGRYAQCEGCSGRHDPFEKTPVDADDFCQCGEGILRWKTKQGQLVIRRMKGDPFGGKVITESKTKDESDWESYLVDLREKMDDENYNPLVIPDVNVFERGFKQL